MYLKNGKMDGADIASYQKKLNIPELPGDFVIVKATQGSWYQSPTFVAQYKAAVDSGKLVGIYHYNEGSDVSKEVDFFLRVIGDRVGHAVLALDEEGISNKLFGTSKMVANVTAFMREVYRRTGVKMLLYMSKSIFRNYDWSALKSEGYKIWPAQYGSNAQTGYKAEPWTDDNGFGAFDQSDVVIYQYTSKGRISGYSGDLDLDKAFIDAAAWKALAGRETSEGAPVEDEDARHYIRMDPQTAFINLALAELGYQEKKSDADLDRKHTNVGKNNYTKYARDMHKIYPATMDANPIPWCDAFVDWLFYKSFGVSTARALIGQFDDYTVASAQQYIKKGAWVTHDFEPGDQIFFSRDESVGKIYHTGVFLKYENNRTYVLEGNTGGGSGVQADGGSVCIKSYPRVPNDIAGAGRPKWDLVGEILIECPELRTLAYGSTRPGVKVIQALLGETVDGHYGPKTRAAVTAFQQVNGLSLTGICGNSTWPSVLATAMTSTGWPKLERGSQGKAVMIMQAVIGAEPDGSFGQATDKALRAFQQEHTLVVDGVCGFNTWKTIEEVLK